jgi:branched-chain amino acid transport system ATP-binding protein
MRLTVAENFRVGRVDMQDGLRLFPELRSRIGVRAGNLSGGEQQMLTLGRALARKPKLLLADELSLGLGPLVVQRLLGAVRMAANDGVGAILVEQHVSAAMAVADRIYVLQRGQVRLEGAAADFAGRLDDIQAAYLSTAAGDETSEESALTVSPDGSAP